MRLFRRIPIETLVASAGGEHGHLKKVLNVRDLIALGVGAIIGAGIFATLGAAASGGENSPPAGPAVTISIIFTAVACGFCALCYAELAGLVPLAGSAYTYSYATLGELPAWIIGWDLCFTDVWMSPGRQGFSSTNCKTSKRFFTVNGG